MGTFLEKLKNAAFEWSASVMYDTPEEGVDYQSLDYQRREKPFFGTRKEHLDHYKAYLHTAMNKQADKPGYSWINELDLADVDRFVEAYVAFYNGSVGDCWFFFKYHYQKYQLSPYYVFPEYKSFRAYQEEKYDKLNEQYTSSNQDYKRRNYRDDDDDDYGGFTPDELAEYYGYDSSMGRRDDFLDDL